MSDDPFHDGWAAQVAAGLARIDPEAAVDLVARIDDAESRRQAMSQLLDGWAGVDPEGAAKWLERADDPGLAPELYARVAQRWYHFDPASATAWVRGLADPAARDAALGTILASDYLDAVDAAALANEIGSLDHRFAAASNRVFQYLRYDPAAARAFIDGLELDAAQREQLRRHVDSQGGY